MKIVWFAVDVVAENRALTSPFASTRYRALQPAAALRAAGMDAEVVDVAAITSEEGAAKLRAADTVILQKFVPSKGRDLQNDIALRRTISDLVGTRSRLILKTCGTPKSLPVGKRPARHGNGRRQGSMAAVLSICASGSPRRNATSIS